MAQPRLMVLAVMGRRDLDGTRAEGSVDALLGNDRHVAVHERDPHAMTDQLRVPPIIGVDRHGGVTKDGLGPGRRGGIVDGAGQIGLGADVRLEATTGAAGNGIGVRLDRLPSHLERDRAWMAEVHEVRDEYERTLAALPPYRREAPEGTEIRWMIEELRISLFAQELRTPYPVSTVRIYRALDALA